MEAICRLCLSIISENSHVFSSENDILQTINSCLSVGISMIDHLPNQACDKCITKINEIKIFRNTIIHNQETLTNYLCKGNNEIYNFYTNITNIIEEKQPVSTTDDKENDNKNEENYFKQEIFDENDPHADDELALSHVSKQVKINKTINTNKRNLKKKKSIVKVEDNIITEEAVNKNIILELNHKCLTCFELFHTQNELLNHYNKDHKEIKNIDLEKNNYTTCSKDGKVIFKCGKCDKVCDNKRAINRHMIAHDDSRPFLCKVCGRTYKTASEIIRHGRAHSGVRLECSHSCGYSTVYMGALREHERRHNTELRYKCEKCEKGFNVKTWYEEHQNVHSGVKPFVCNLCGQAFHMSRYLTAHRSSVHPQSSDLKRYICVHCSLPCDSKNALTEHMKEHGIKTCYLCDMCGKTLSNAEHLKFHKLMHLGVKPYSCGTCAKSFTKKFNLTLHERTHSGEKTHVCGCGRRYAQRSTLRRHASRHHPASLQKTTK